MIFEAHHSPASGIDLYLGDCKVIMEHLCETAPDGLADFICVDPPYGIDYVNEAGVRVTGDSEPPLWCVPLMADLMKPNTALLLFSRFDVSLKWDDAMRDAGLFPPHDHEGYVGWDKGYLTPGEVVAPISVGEIMNIGCKGDLPVRSWIDNGRFFPNNPGRVLDYVQDWESWQVRGPRDKLSRRHPTPKPPRLMERALLNYSGEHDLVFDPFMGGAPVGVACVRLGRRYIGIEIERDHFDLAVENIEFEFRKRSILRRAKVWSNESTINTLR